MPLIASAAAVIPRSDASRDTLSARRVDSTARCPTSFTDALISVMDEEVCSADAESASVFSDTCLIDAIICSIDDDVSSTAAASAAVFRATSSIDDAISDAEDDAFVDVRDISDAFSATPLIEETISFTVIAVCSVDSCWTRAPWLILTVAPAMSRMASATPSPVVLILPSISRRFDVIVLMAPPRSAISFSPLTAISCVRSPAAIRLAVADISEMGRAMPRSMKKYTSATAIRKLRPPTIRDHRRRLCVCCATASSLIAIRNTPIRFPSAPTRGITFS